MSRWLFKPSRVARVRLYYSCLRGLDCIKVGRLAGRAAEKHTPSSTTHTRSTAWDPYITDSWFNVAAVKTARPQRSTGIRTYIHTVPWTFQDLLGWTLFPLLESIRDKVHTSPPALCRLHRKKVLFWVMIKAEKSGDRKTKAAFSHSLMCKYMQYLFFYPPTCPVVRSAQVPQTSCHSAPLIPFTSCLSHPEMTGLGGPASAKVYPAQNLQTCVL